MTRFPRAISDQVPTHGQANDSDDGLGSAIVEWLADEALQDSKPAILYRELCQ
jgi:hypothetical protein